MFADTSLEQEVVADASAPSRRKKSAAPAKPATTVVLNLGQLAMEAAEQADGDTARGAENLMGKILDEFPDFYQRKSKELFVLWAQDQIRNSRNHMRSRLANKIYRPPASMQPLNSQSLRSAASAWFGWPVLPGVLLGQANRAQLEKAAADYQQQANTMLRRGEWLSAIADAMPQDDSIVSAVLNESAIADMAKQFGVAAS